MPIVYNTWRSIVDVISIPLMRRCQVTKKGLFGRLLVGILVVGALLVGCQPHRVDDSYAPREERQDLIAALEALEVQGTDYGRQWSGAVESAGVSPETAALPYAETYIFDPIIPEARVLDVTLEEPGSYTFFLEADTGGYVFMDLYRRDQEELVPAATRDPETPEIVIDLRRPGEYRLVLQPEPLRGGRVRLRIERREEG